MGDVGGAESSVQKTLPVAKWICESSLTTFQYFGNFSEDLALLAQNILHGNLRIDGNAIICWNCIAIESKKLLVYPPPPGLKPRLLVQFFSS